MAVRRTTDARGRTRYVVEFEQSKVRVLRRLPVAATKAQADALEVKLRREIFDQRGLGRQPELTLERAVDLWLRDKLHGKKDQRMPVQNAAHLRPFLRGRTVSEAGEAAREAIQAWTDTTTPTGIAAQHARNARRRSVALPTTGASWAVGRSDRGRAISAATINRRLAVLKAAVVYAFAQGWTEQNVSKRIGRLREPPGREVYLTPSQTRLLSRQMPSPKYAAAIMLLAYTGLRAGELLALTAEDITPDSLMVRQSKSGKARTVPVSGPALPYLRALPLALSYQQLQWAWRAARTAAGMPHVRIHDLRHTTASWLINAGVDLYTVGKILGHSTPSTTARYAHLADKSLRRAMSRLK